MSLKLVDKSSNVTDAVLNKHIRAITAAKHEMAEATGVYRSLLKAAKADGVNQGSLLAAMRGAAHGEDRVKLDLRDYVRYLGLFHMPVQQTDLFAEEAEVLEVDSEHMVWEATEAGKTAGKAGGHRNENPHKLGSESFVAWDKGWKLGQAKIAREMNPKAKIASTRRKRGPAEPDAETPIPFDA